MRAPSQGKKGSIAGSPTFSEHKDTFQYHLQVNKPRMTYPLNKKHVVSTGLGQTGLHKHITK